MKVGGIHTPDCVVNKAKPAPIRLSREQLYEEIWKTPARLLSVRFGISDVGLAKVCKRMGIPRPTRGYWRKKETGHRVRRVALPKAKPEHRQEVVFFAEAGTVPRRWKGARIAPEIFLTFDRPHPYVEITSKSLRTASSDTDGILALPATAPLSVRVSRNNLSKALRIADAFLKAWLDKGHELQPKTEEFAGQAELGELIYFSKSNSETKIRRIPVEQLQPEEISKIRREVMRTRGELLFARAVVLFEGVTEEQALPMFARHHWGMHPFQLGVSFVGVGGSGNYFPFISLLEAFGIGWYIFSDGEPTAQRDVRSALRRASLPETDARAVFLTEGTDIETYLVAQGYQAELRTAIIELMRPTFRNEQHALAKSRAVSGWSDACISAYLGNNKTAASPYWAHSIIAAGGERSVPAAIRKLLDSIKTGLSGFGIQGEIAT